MNAHGSRLLLAVWLAVTTTLLRAVPLFSFPDLPPATRFSSSPAVLWVLPLLLPDSADVPPRLLPAQAEIVAHSLVRQEARPLLAELRRLQAAGAVTAFALRPELHGVLIEGASAETLTRLAHLVDAAALLPLVDQVNGCAAAVAQALTAQVLEQSRPPDAARQTVAARATDPTVDVYASPTGAAHSRSRVVGTTSANTTVDLRVLRGSQVLVAQSTTSDVGGNYTFAPTWHDCPFAAYSWTLRPGDVVQVTANGNTVATVVAPLLVWVDPLSNTVAGSTDLDRSVDVRLYDYGADPCAANAVSRATAVDGSGAFALDFSAQVDFDRRAEALVCARDSANNGTCGWFYADRLTAALDGDTFSGYLEPQIGFTATLSRAGGLLSTVNGTSHADGSYAGQFSTAFQPGDVIEVSGGSSPITLVAVDLQVVVDPLTDQASGTTAAGRLVTAQFARRLDGYVRTACSAASGCGSDLADSGGAFAVTAPLDLARGDVATLFVYDAQGNGQFSAAYSTAAIVADLSLGAVGGYWSDPAASILTIILRDDGGAVRETIATNIGDDGGFFDYVVVTPTFTIQVTDGVMTETMVVQDLTARLDGGTGHLSGNASPGGLLAVMSDFRRDAAENAAYCVESQVTGTSYDLTFAGASVGGQDSAELWNTGPDGHTTFRTSFAFTVNAQKESDYVWGYTELPATSVDVVLRRGEVTVANASTTSEADGYFAVYLIDILQGDTLQVQTGDGDSASLSIPELTFSVDAAGNRLYGRSPASQPLQSELIRHYNGPWSINRYSFTADAFGDYSAGFNGLYWERDCSAVAVGHSCVLPLIYYYDDAGHNVWLEGAYPLPATADAYEDDDLNLHASAYGGIQAHTFHIAGDTDWISFTVPVEDVDDNVPYLIETLDLGWGMATNVELYNSSMGLLGAWYAIESAGRGVSMWWTPAVAGIYYLKIWPGGGFFPYCDAVYRLQVLPRRSALYLPLVARSY